MNDSIKDELKILTYKYFSGLNVMVDIEVLFLKLSKYNLTVNQVESLFKSIIKNMELFERELNYPSQVSNLFFFEIDALNEPQENCRGTEYRHNLTKQYRNILNS